MYFLILTLIAFCMVIRFWNITDETKAGAKVQHLPGLTLASAYPDI
jgi:hypothetical protein